MFECNWLSDAETVVKNKNDFTLTFDKWAGFLFVDNSNALHTERRGMIRLCRAKR